MEIVKTFGLFVVTALAEITDWVGVGVCLLGMAIIMFGPRHA